MEAYQVLKEISRHNVRCGQCGQIMRRGIPRFGPGEVICGNCGALNRTGLEGWSDLFLPRKLWLAFLEIVTPSRFGKTCYTFLVLNMISWILLGASLFMFVVGSPVCGWITLGVYLFCFYGLAIYRLIRIIRESNEYTETRRPPVWKLSSF